MIEIKRKTSGVVAEFAVQPLLMSGEMAVVEYRVPREYREPVSGLVVPAGTMSYGFFWQGRPFNVYYFVDQGKPLAAYFNICTSHTILTPEVIDWTDLEVDVIVYPDGRWFVVDEDEVPDTWPPGQMADLERGKQWILQQDGQPLLQEMKQELQRLGRLGS